MPLRLSEIEKYSIKIAEKNEVYAWVGPCSVKKINVTKIPLDGRMYECSGTIILAKGVEMQASFRIKKSNESLLIEDSVYIKIDEVWYKLGEPEFFVKTELEYKDIFPIEWITDIPLETPAKGPFKIDFKG